MRTRQQLGTGRRHSPFIQMRKRIWFHGLACWVQPLAAALEAWVRWFTFHSILLAHEVNNGVEGTVQSDFTLAFTCVFSRFLQTVKFSSCANLFLCSGDRHFLKFCTNCEGFDKNANLNCTGKKFLFCVVSNCAGFITTTFEKRNV